MIQCVLVFLYIYQKKKISISSEWIEKKKHIFVKLLLNSTQFILGCVARHIHERQRGLKSEVVWVGVGSEVEGGGVRHQVSVG